MPSPTNEELHFYYFGLYRVLKRYRVATVLGWLIVGLGAVTVPFGWGSGSPHEIFDIGLSALTITAGLAVVSFAVTFLSSYVTVTFPATHGGDGGEQNAPVVLECQSLMAEIERGGWQDAFHALGRLKEFQVRYSLPDPDR